MRAALSARVTIAAIYRYSVSPACALAQEADSAIDHRQFRANLYFEPRSGQPVDGARLLKRRTMIVRGGRVEHVFYAAFSADQNAEEVLRWLREHPL